MGRHAFHAAMGPTYEVVHAEELDFGSYSAASYTWDGTTVPVRSAGASLCLATATDILGTDFTEELHLGDGRLLLGQYEARDEEIAITYGRPTVALWTDGNAAIWLETETRDLAWSADLMAHLEPAARDGVAVATNADPRQVTVEREEVLVTLFPSQALLKVHTTNAWTTPTTEGQRAPAGELYVQSRGQGSPRQAILRAASAILIASEADMDADGAVEFLRGFHSIHRTAPGE